MKKIKKLLIFLTTFYISQKSSIKLFLNTSLLINTLRTSINQVQKKFNPWFDESNEALKTTKWITRNSHGLSFFFFFLFSFLNRISIYSIHFCDFALYHQIKISISFLCKRKLNHKSLIQPSNILLIELTEIHHMIALY